MNSCVWDLLQRAKAKYEIESWEKAGKPAPSTEC